MHGGVSLFLLCFGMHIKYANEKDEGALIILNTSEVPKFYLKCLKRLNPIIIMDALNCFLRKCL